MIGEEISVQIDVIPAQFLVIRHIRPQYACRACETVAYPQPAPWPVRPWPNGWAEPVRHWSPWSTACASGFCKARCCMPTRPRWCNSIQGRARPTGLTCGDGAALQSLIGTARLNGIDPNAWLRDTLEKLPTWRIGISTSCCRCRGGWRVSGSTLLQLGGVAGLDAYAYLSPPRVRPCRAHQKKGPPRRAFHASGLGRTSVTFYY